MVSKVYTTSTTFHIPDVVPREESYQSFYIMSLFVENLADQTKVVASYQLRVIYVRYVQ